jgi:hypothetical protein
VACERAALDAKRVKKTGHKRATVYRPARQTPYTSCPSGGRMTVMTYSVTCFVCGERITEADYETSVIDFTSKPEDGKPLPRTHARCWAARVKLHVP